MSSKSKRIGSSSVYSRKRLDTSQINKAHNVRNGLSLIIPPKESPPLLLTKTQEVIPVVEEPLSYIQEFSHIQKNDSVTVIDKVLKELNVENGGLFTFHNTTVENLRIKSSCTIRNLVIYSDCPVTTKFAKVKFVDCTITSTKHPLEFLHSSCSFKRCKFRVTGETFLLSDTSDLRFKSCKISFEGATIFSLKYGSFSSRSCSYNIRSNSIVSFFLDKTANHSLIDNKIFVKHGRYLLGIDYPFTQMGNTVLPESQSSFILEDGNIYTMKFLKDTSLTKKKLNVWIDSSLNEYLPDVTCEIVGSLRDNTDASKPFYTYNYTFFSVKIHENRGDPVIKEAHTKLVLSSFFNKSSIKFQALLLEGTLRMVNSTVIFDRCVLQGSYIFDNCKIIFRSCYIEDSGNILLQDSKCVVVQSSFLCRVLNTNSKLYTRDSISGDDIDVTKLKGPIFAL